LQDQARKLHANVFQIQAAISSELAGQMTLDCPYQVRIGAACFEKAYTRLCKTVFSEQWQDTSIEPDIELVFDGELLGVPEIDFTPEWDQRIPNDILRKAILNLVAEGEIDWLRAYDLYADQASHVASGLLLRYLLFINAPTEMTEQIARRRQDDIGEATERLERAAKVALQEVEEAAAYSQLYEGERNHYVAEIERVRKEVNRIPDFRNALSNIAAIREQLNGKRNEAVAKVQRRMVEHRIDQTHEAFQRISKVLETGDFLSANEYIEKVIAGVALPEEATTTDHFTSFFPAKMKEIERFLDPRTFSVKKVLRDLTAEGRHGYRLGPIDMTRVQGAQADQVVKALKSWELLRSQNVYANTVIEVFRFLGFVSPRVILEKQPSNWADLTTEPLNNRDLCPVRQYGSDSAGKYRVLLISGNPSAEDIVNSIPDTPSRTPTIVLHFNQIAEEKRRELAAISRHRRKMFIVIDETLLYFLCGFKSPRLRIMFECTLPFTLLDPYTTTAGIVPPEVFFGRRKERELIIDPMGSCFIYGGRQLGKTALLRDVERTYHDLAKGHIVSWLDLKVEGIGLDRDIEDIWYLIARELKRHGLLPSSITPGQIGTERLAEYVEGWLAQDEQRRVLFLLDEADTFLEADASNSGKEFLHSQRLKGLMDRTNRRFKAVFAGLHNVQRTTRHGNHPLAHYGTPICIGPLLDNGEWRAATGLVHDPLASAGYRFESPDLITRILSQTNYYPSLIQLYCAELVGHLTNPNDTNFDRKTSPPYQIANRHVADVYRNEDFRQGIRQRFNWTLQLDTRYEVIAYSIAHATLDDKSPDVFSIDWIRSEAIYWCLKASRIAHPLTPFVHLQTRW
jgi:hypothetical protein